MRDRISPALRGCPQRARGSRFAGLSCLGYVGRVFAFGLSWILGILFFVLFLLACFGGGR
jgi:hypothetical protein